MTLHIPIDWERLPEYRRLVAEVRSRAGEWAEPLAARVWLRLWVELAYQAQVTNRPGWLSREAAPLYRESVREWTGEADPVQWMEAVGALRAVEDGWECERFARLNPHLAGNYKPKELKGNAHSAFVRGQKQAAREALGQAMLLPPEILRAADGTPLTSAEINRCVVLIRNLDNCLGRRARRVGEFTEGLIADAHAVASRHSPDTLRPFYFWLLDNRDNPAMPDTAEQVLTRFDELKALADETQKPT